MIPVGILTAAATSSFSFLLDDYSGAFTAFSLRKLRSAYTGNCIEVRRSSDNTTLDIGFSNNVLDTTTLLTFCGAGNGFVSKWYDQSGNAKDSFQNTFANQPQIVSSGTVITTNGKPSLQVGSSDFLQVGGTNGILVRTTFSVVKRNNVGDMIWVYGEGIKYGQFSDNKFYFYTTTDAIPTSLADLTTNQMLLSNYNTNNTTAFQYKNNILLASGTNVSVSSTATLNIIFAIPSLSLFTNGFGQEMVFYSFDNSANLTGINNNINSFYTIY